MARHRDADAVLHLADTGGGHANTFNLCELVATLDRAFGRAHNPGFADWRPGDQRVFIADIRKAERALGWKPTVATPAGVDRLLSWIHGNPGLFQASGR